MADLPLLAQLLISKRQRDSSRRREDALLSRQDHWRELERGDRLAQNEYMRGVEDRRLTLAEEANQRAAEQMRFGQEQTILGNYANSNLQPFGVASGQGLGAMAADTMLRNSSRILPNTSQSPTTSVGGHLFRARSQPELAAQQAEAESRVYDRNQARAMDEYKTAIGMTPPPGTRILGAGPYGVPKLGVEPQPRAPRVVPQAEVNAQNQGRVNAAIQQFIMGGAGQGRYRTAGVNPANLDQEDVPTAAAQIAEQYGVPFDLTWKLLQDLVFRSRPKSQATGAGGGSSATKRFLNDLNIPPIG